MKEINLKELWNEYRELEERKALSGVVINKMIRERSRSEMDTIGKMEYSSLFVFAGLIVLFAVSVFLYGSDSRFLLVSSGGIVLSAGGLVWTLVLLRRIRAVDFSKDSFVKVRSSVATIRRLLVWERTGQFVFFPLFLACVFPVMYMMVQGLNIFEEFQRVAMRIVLGYLAITVVTLWIYKQFYFRKLAVIEKETEEAEELG